MHYAGKGARLIITGRDAARLTETKTLAQDSGSSGVTSHLIDVTDAEHMDKCLTHEFGKGSIDIVIANAGVSGKAVSGCAGTERRHNMLNYSTNYSVDSTNGDPLRYSNWREIMPINYNGVLNTVLPAARLMANQGFGRIGVISSLAGLVGLPSAPAYSASKAALNAHMDAIRPAFEKQNIKLTLVCPGFIKTPLVANNPFPMPLMMEAEKAAVIIAKAIEKGKRSIAFPCPSFLAAKTLSLLPTFIRDSLLGRIQSKE